MRPQYPLTHCSIQANQENSPFLRLPAEIRNRIYELTLAGSIVKVKSTEHPSMSLQRSANSHGSGSALGLLHVCAQIRHDAQAIFWSRCVIDLTLINAPSGTLFNEVPFAMVRGIAQKVQLFRISRTTAWTFGGHRRSRGNMGYYSSKCDIGYYWTNAFISLRRVQVASDDVTGALMFQVLRRSFNNQDLEVEFDP
jgi:hypothetical protein